MSEQLEVYDLSWNYKKVMWRDDYYKEIKTEYAEKQSISTQVKRLSCMILTPEWNIILQKRSDDKKENPDRYDKSIWWHIAIMKDSSTNIWSLSRELSDINMTKEALEELNIPSHITSQDYFTDSLSFWIEKMAFITRIERIMWNKSKRVNKDGTNFEQSYITDFYMGYYNGPVQFSDWEACWLEYVNKEKLLEKIEKNPDNYTHDLQFILDRYWDYLLPINKFIQKFKKDEWFNLKSL